MAVKIYNLGDRTPPLCVKVTGQIEGTGPGMGETRFELSGERCITSIGHLGPDPADLTTGGDTPTTLPPSAFDVTFGRSRAVRVRGPKGRKFLLFLNFCYSAPQPPLPVDDPRFPEET